MRPPTPRERSALTLERYFPPDQRWGIEQYRLWGAKVTTTSWAGGVPAAACWWVPGQVAEVKALVVARPFRRSGFGRQLLRRVVKLARRAGAEQLFLWVVADNAPAIALYKSEGFSVAKTVLGRAKMVRDV